MERSQMEESQPARYSTGTPVTLDAQRERFCSKIYIIYYNYIYKNPFPIQWIEWKL